MRLAASAARASSTVWYTTLVCCSAFYRTVERLDIGQHEAAPDPLRAGADIAPMKPPWRARAW
jgi:hypothetical protein